jgi:formylglycine-generating enzyme required for sulfatase activity
MNGRAGLLVAAMVYCSVVVPAPVRPIEQPRTGAEWVVPGIGMEFVWVAALKGWAGKYEVTNGEYRRWKPKHDSGQYKDQLGRLHSLNEDRQPVVEISYAEAVDYAKWLTERERNAGRLASTLEYRLPNGYEWTMLAQCGDDREYPWGDSWPPKYGNYRDRSFVRKIGWSSELGDYDDGYGVSAPVEKSGKNKWGLFGMGGNIWERTSERKGESPVNRGSAWLADGPRFMKCTALYYSRTEDSRAFCTGFRLLLMRVQDSAEEAQTPAPTEQRRAGEE